MDIYNFINSKDIYRYLRSINYEFSPLECAWLIWQSRRATVNDRHEAWSDIINTMPDCEIPNYKDSLHTFLRNLISVEKNAIQRFFEKTEDSIYTGLVTTIDGAGGFDTTAFLLLEDCISNLNNLMDSDVLYYNITKSKLEDGAYQDNIIVHLDAKSNAAYIRLDNFENAFDKVTLKFPLPFKKGDILKRTSVGIPGLYLPDYTEKLVYLYYADDEGSERDGGYDEMTVTGYFWRYDRLSLDSYACYMDYEIADAVDEIEDSLLVLTSSFLKKRMNPVEYAENYHLAKLKIELDLRDRINR